MNSLPLHMIEYPDVVPVFPDSPLQLVEQEPQLHADDQRRHGQEDVAPDQHVQMVKQVHGQGSQLEGKLGVVRQRRAAVAGRTGRGGAGRDRALGRRDGGLLGGRVAGFQHVQAVAEYHMHGTDAKQAALEKKQTV